MHKYTKEEAQLISKEIGKQSRVLDIGSTDGMLEKMLDKLDIVGIENSSTMLEKARKNSCKLFVKGSSENLPFLKNEFDAVIMHMPSSYIENCYKTLNEIYNVLKENGIIIAFITINSGTDNTLLDMNGPTILEEFESCLEGKFKVERRIAIGKAGIVAAIASKI
jgi:ubiquinone/menaquinone biosynthesis C-methylase UbiE